MSVVRLAQHHRLTLALAVGFLTAAGLLSLFGFPASIYPEVAFPRIAVIARGGTFEARDMTVAVTRPLEEAVSGTLGLHRIRSRTVRGSAELSLDFDANADMQLALQQVQARLADERASLPDDVEILAERLTPSVFPVLQFVLTGADPADLSDLARLVVRPRFAPLPDVAQVEVQSSEDREVTVELDPERLVTTGVTVPDVADAIRAGNVATAAGRVPVRYKESSLVVSALAAAPDAVGRMVVRQAGDRALTVADLGAVRLGHADRFQIISANGRPAALVNVSLQPNGNILRLRRAVEDEAEAIRHTLPPGVRLDLVYDQGEFVRDSIAGVRDAMLIGGALAVLVLLLFLQDAWLTFAAGLSLPLAVAGTFACLRLLGGSLNLMTLGGLAVAIGLVIDDAVVVVENIDRHLKGIDGVQGPAADAVRVGTEEIFGPVLGSTLTTVVVFMPLGLLGGVVGDFFRAFSLALAIAVLLSLFLATTLIPALLESRARRPIASDPGEAGLAPRRRSWLPFDRVARIHERALRRLLEQPRLAVVGAVVLVVLAVGLSRVVGTGFLPEMDEGGFILDYVAPVGTALAETDRQLRGIERILGADPAVQGFSRRTGSELGFAATALNTGDFTVRLVPRSRRPPANEVIARLRRRIATEVPVVEVEFVQLLQDVIGDLAGSPEPVEVKLFSTDPLASEEAARRVESAVEHVPGLVDLVGVPEGGDPVRRVDLDPVRVARIGLTPIGVETQAQAALFGAEAGVVQLGERLVPIRARLPDSLRRESDVELDVPILGPNGWTPLSSLGKVRDTLVASELRREDLRPLARVTGHVEGSNLGAVMSRVRSAVERTSLPAGVSVVYGGQYASQQESFRQFVLVLLLAAGAVLLVLVAQFRELRGPLVVVAAAPFGLPGALAALALAGVPFNVASFMGLVLLVGIVVKNGILLVDSFRRELAQGQPRREAVVRAGRARLRPILMTTLCTLAGLAPLALGWGQGSELQRPLAVAVIGGLVLSTAVTLLLVPVALERVGSSSGRVVDP